MRHNAALVVGHSAPRFARAGHPNNGFPRDYRRGRPVGFVASSWTKGMCPSWNPCPGGQCLGTNDPTVDRVVPADQLCRLAGRYDRLSSWIPRATRMLGHAETEEHRISIRSAIPTLRSSRCPTAGPTTPTPVPCAWGVDEGIFTVRNANVVVNPTPPADRPPHNPHRPAHKTPPALPIDHPPFSHIV